MADQDTAPDDDQALKKRLLTRVAIAGVVIVALLGGLALIDTLQSERPAKPGPRQQPAVTTAHAPQSGTAGEKTTPPPVATQSDAGIIRGGEPAAPEEEKAAKPPAEGTTALPAPPGEDRGPTRPAEARVASLRPAESATPARRAEREVTALAAPTPPRVPAPPAAPVTALPPATAPALTPVQPVPTRHAPPSRPLSRLAETSAQFVLQLGVFSNLANAEELRARLELAGVPAHLEARVQVGPFATREEAAQAQEKIRALGLEPGLVVAVKR